MSNEHQPYLRRRVSRTILSYNPNYTGPDLCRCGHSYDRHFDPYEDWAAVGCKYCPCATFKPSKTPTLECK